MSIINKLLGRPAALKETLFEDIKSVVESTKQKSFAIEYTLESNARTVLVFNRSRNVALIYNSDKPLNIEERLYWASESIHSDMINKAKEVSQDIDTNRYMSFVHRFGHTGDFIDYINVIYRDYSLQSLIELQEVFPEGVVKRNIVGLNSVDTEKFDFLNLSVDRLEKTLNRRRDRYIATLSSYGVPESELSHFIIYSAENMNKYEDIEKIINYATIDKITYDELFEQSNGFLWWDIVETSLIFAARGLVEIVDNRTRQFVELFDVEATLAERQHYTESNADNETVEANFEEMLQEVNDSAEIMDGDTVIDDSNAEETVNNTFNVLQNMNDIETVDSDLIDDTEEENFWEYDEVDDLDDIESDSDTEEFEEDLEDTHEYNAQDILDAHNYSSDYLENQDGVPMEDLEEYDDPEFNDLEEEFDDLNSEEDSLADDGHVVLEDFNEIEFQDEDEEEVINYELDVEYDKVIDNLDGDTLVEDEDTDDLYYEDDEEADFVHDFYKLEDESLIEEPFVQDSVEDNSVENPDQVYQEAISVFNALEDKMYYNEFEKSSDILLEEDFEYIVDSEEKEEDESFEYIDIDEDLDEDKLEDVFEYYENNEEEHEFGMSELPDDFDTSRIIRLPDLGNIFDSDEISSVSTVETEEDDDFVNTVVSPENTLKILGVEPNDFGNKFKDLIKEKRNAEERLAIIPKLIRKCHKESEEVENLLEETESKISSIQEEVTRKKALMEAAIEAYNESNEKLDTYSAKGVEYRQQIKRIFENIESYETEEKFYHSVRDSAEELIGRAVNEAPETVSNFSDVLDSMHSHRAKIMEPKQESMVILNDITHKIIEAHPLEVYENEGGGVLKEDLLKKEQEDHE